MGENDLMTGYMMGQNDGGGNRNGGMFGGDGLWGLIIILALLGGLGNGFGLGGGGNNGGGGGMTVMPYMMGGGCFGGSNCATQADLAAGFNNSAVLNNLNDLKLGQAGIQQTLCQGFSGINTTVMQGFHGVERGFCDLSHQISDCCCTTQRAIDGVNYNLATGLCNLQNAMNSNTRDIIDGQREGTRAILDFLVQDKISTLTAENQNLRFAASQSNQNAVLMAAMDANKAEILRRTGSDCPTAAYIVQPPTPVRFNQGCGCGCGGGTFGTGYAA